MTVESTKTTTDVNADFQNKILNDIKATSDSAYNEMLAKKEQYEAAKVQEEIYAQLRSRAETKYMDLLSAFRKGESVYGLAEAQSKYFSYKASYTDASNNTDLLRGSLQNRISYASKMGNSAAIANAMLA